MGVLTADLNLFFTGGATDTITVINSVRLTCDGQSIEEIGHRDYSSSDDRCVVERAQSSERR